jgi:NitT/TauT family transport system ATP-binding protein
VIEVDHISFAFQDEKVLSDILFTVHRAEIVAILGPSGVGKTTLLRCIAGLLHPSTGTIRIEGDSPAAAARAQKVGFLFQQDSLLEWRTVHENVTLPFEVRTSRLPSTETNVRVSAAVRLVGLAESTGKFPRELSGGMRQRVALARALAPEPRILILDEPFAAVDLLTRERIMIDLHGILRKATTPTIIVTHHVEEAIFLSDRLLLLGGKPATVIDTWETKLGSDRTQDLLNASSYLDLVLALKQKLRTVGSTER